MKNHCNACAGLRRCDCPGGDVEGIWPRRALRWEEGNRPTVHVFDSLPRPVGIMAAYDVRALEVLAAVRSLGLECPDDVAVVGVALPTRPSSAPSSRRPSA
ncbi:MAG: substrate-binding domain-containing protein [Planctomycetota bacterium]